MKGKIFNAQEVQAIIAGNKTMFREVVKTCKQHPNNVCRKVRNAHYGLNLKEDGLFWQPYGGSELQPFPYCDGKLSASTSLDEFCPYQVGQKIKPKPKSGSIDLQLRLFGIELLIKKIRVERLADISEDDAIKEGVDYFSGTPEYNRNPSEWYEPDSGWLNYEEDEYTCEDEVQSFATLWDTTHKKPEEKWEANPWVWVVDFKVNK